MNSENVKTIFMMWQSTWVLGAKGKNCVYSQQKKDVVFSAERLNNFQVNLGFRINRWKVTNFLRSTKGKKAIPTKFNEHMCNKWELLADIYKQGEFDFETEKKIKEKSGYLGRRGRISGSCVEWATVDRQPSYWWLMVARAALRSVWAYC